MTLPLRPIVFALGLACCLGGAITCATAAPDAPQTFPSLSDGMILGGLVLVVLGAAGRKPRGRQMLDASSKRPPSA